MCHRPTDLNNRSSCLTVREAEVHVQVAYVARLQESLLLVVHGQLDVVFSQGRKSGPELLVLLEYRH
jgi:hypothetical protein